MESTVENVAIEGSQPVDGAVADEVASSSLVDAPEGTAGAQRADAPAKAQSASAEPTRDGSAQPQQQEPESRAFSRRLSEARTKDRQRFESEPAYQLGYKLIQQRAAKDGISAQEAAARIESEYVTQRAAEFAKNPQAYYEAAIRGEFTQTQQPTKQPAQQSNPQDVAASFTQQLIAAKESGAMPENFAPEHIDAKFARRAQRYGVEAALEMWADENAGMDAVVGELQRRSTAPKPMRPASAGGASAPAPNFQTMSSEEFKKIDEAAARAAYSGKRVTFK